MNGKNILGLLQLRKQPGSLRPLEGTDQELKEPAESLFTWGYLKTVFHALISKGKINIIFPCLFQTITVSLWYTC